MKYAGSPILFKYLILNHIIQQEMGDWVILHW